MKRLIIILFSFLLVACTTKIDRIWQRTDSTAKENYQEDELDESDKSLYRAGIVTLLFLFAFSATGMYASLMFLHQRTKKQNRNNRFRVKNARLEKLLTAQQAEIEESYEQSKQNAVLAQEIEQLRTQIKIFQTKLTDKITEREQLFYDSDIYSYFSSFKDDKFNHEAPTKEDWKKMISSFRKTFPNYYKFIAEENSLTLDQLKVCILIRLFYPVYTMQRILDADSNRITRIKRQTNKKLFDEDSAASLENNLKRHQNERV